MDSLTKLIVLFAALGLIGLALFFFPGSPLHHERIRTIIITQTVEKESAEENNTSEPQKNEAVSETSSE